MLLQCPQPPELSPQRRGAAQQAPADSLQVDVTTSATGITLF